MYDTLKMYKTKPYTGMEIGKSHLWNYKNGKWLETKIAPDKWTIKFDSLKTRSNVAPQNSGAGIHSQFHWYIIADQIATKISNNSYQTSMNGVKFKIGHKRSHWKSFSYEYPEQMGYKEHVINILEDILRKLKNEK
ncbi:MAG: hypothetical protein ACFFAO_10000 [Candidatus Hermodarchaeota archaeon]